MHDLKYAVRLLRRQPKHALLTVVTMALAIGATTTLFGVTYGVLLKPLRWPNADRVVVVKETRGGSAPRFGEFTNAAYLAWREQAATVTDIAAWSIRAATFTGAGEPERIRLTVATPSLFQVLGARPLIGSFFDRTQESAPVIVLTEGVWRQRFGADPGVLGALVHLDGVAHTVVGVLPERLAFPDSQSRGIVPLAIPPVVGNSLSLFNALALLAPDRTAAQAAAEGTARGRFAADTGLTTMAIFGSTGPLEVSAQPLREALTADVRQPLMLLLTAVALLLMAATANVANLQLVRAATRGRELAIRTALGASGARVTRQLLVEGVLLGALGGMVGLGVAVLLSRSLAALLPSGFPRVDELGIDRTVAGFAVAISVAASIVFGLVPAWRVRRLSVGEALADDGAASVGVSGRTGFARARLPIMTAQVAIACVLLIGATLLGRSFFALLNADRGFDPSEVLSARLSMPSPLFDSPERRFAAVDSVLARVAALPGMRHVAITSELPLTPGGSSSAFTMRSPADGGTVRVQASPRIVSSGYFDAIGMRLVTGRAFLPSDTETSEPVVVVNETFARRYLGASPLASRIPMAGYGPPDGQPVECTVVGVVADVRYVAAAETSLPELYYSHRQMRGRLPVQTVTLIARTHGDPAAASRALRSAIREVDDRLATDAVTRLDDRLLTTLARPRLYAVLLAAFAGFSLLTAAVGLFGVLSYSVSQRSREFAVRSALGASRADILGLVLRQGMAVAAAGLVIGVLVSAWLTRLISAQLYGVAPHDAVTFTVVPLVLLVVAACASMMPAYRAATIDPLRVIRGD